MDVLVESVILVLSTRCLSNSWQVGMEKENDNGGTLDDENRIADDEILVVS